ncbi:MAG TPA: hypothetical protein VHE30_25905 [Polyangiaceae bacterium]|nr:hypothetical protein [Polyangiaceae bacterium]
MKYSTRIHTTALTIALATSGCGSGERSPSTEDETGVLTAALSRVPDGVHCLRVVSIGARTVEKLISVSPGDQPVKLDVRLPIGPQTIAGEALEETCPASPDQVQGEPTWKSDPVFVRILAGVVKTIHLTMHKKGDTHVEVDFDTEGRGAAVSSGTDFTCALADDGAAYCWGANGVGQTGTGSPQNVQLLVPTPVSGLPAPARALAAGGGHACTVLDDGTAYCWGFGEWGQIGAPVADWTEVPLLVEGLPPARDVALGGDHSCAITAVDDVYCWGLNSSGQIGDGTMDNRGSAVPVPELADIRALALGGAHSCAVLDDRSVKCWGSNSAGQLGHGGADSATPCSVPGPSGIVALAAGRAHTCAVDGDGVVSCWGANGHGQLGDGSSTDRGTPAEVSALPAPAVSVRAHGDTTCAVLSDDSAWCWGENAGGQVGDGSTTDRWAPTAVTGLGASQDVSPGRNHTCALGATGVVSCWGQNSMGQLGDGTTTAHLAPAPATF